MCDGALSLRSRFTSVLPWGLEPLKRLACNVAAVHPRAGVANRSSAPSAGWHQWATDRRVVGPRRFHTSHTGRLPRPLLPTDRTAGRRRAEFVSCRWRDNRRMTTTSLAPVPVSRPVTLLAPGSSAYQFVGLTEADASRIAAAMTDAIADSARTVEPEETQVRPSWRVVVGRSLNLALRRWVQLMPRRRACAGDARGL